MSAVVKPWEKYQPWRSSGEARGTTLEQAPKPDLSYDMIPKERYTSREFMQMEWDRMWTKTWLMTVRESELPSPGDYATYDIGHESFIIVRGEDHQVRAFYNVCLHRGNRLRPCENARQCSHATSFQCAYHHWEWHLDGKLKRIPELEESFSHLVGKEATLGLKSLKCDTWGGWVWVSMNPDIEPLLEFLDPIPAHFAAYQPEKYIVGANLTIEWDCNWKASVDAFNEAYHVQGIHPQLYHYIDDLNLQFDCYKRHARMLVPQCTNSPRVRGHEELHHYTSMFLEGFGKDLDYFKANPLEARRAIHAAKRAVENESHFPYETLSDEQLTDDYHYTIFPNAQFNTYAEGAMTFVSRPHPTDPNKMYWDLLFYTYPEPGQEGENAEHKFIKQSEMDMGDAFLNEVLEQDAFNLPHVQAGMRSQAYEGLLVGEQEIRVAFYHKVLMEQYINHYG